MKKLGMVGMHPFGFGDLLVSFPPPPTEHKKQISDGWGNLMACTGTNGRDDFVGGPVFGTVGFCWLLLVAVRVTSGRR